MIATTSAKILVVDDDIDIIEMLQYNLRREGYEVRTASNGKEALEIAKYFQPRLILMDIMMPVMDGVEASRQIRELPESSEAYIIFLTARSEEYSEVAAFDVGGDDYIVKPIKPRALMSRVSAIFRRDSKKYREEEHKLYIRDLIIDKKSYTVVQGDKIYSLPRKEFELLYFLAQSPDKVFTRDDLLQNIWGLDVYVMARTVDVHVRKLREKIGLGYIKTVKGVGYKIKSSFD